jgi:NAD(P)-dependent dehydrogenase (short-subunit alcohol dehydrogenase family)
MTDLTGNTYIVTGASRGFGRAITEALLETGANVGMIARNEEILQHAVAELDSSRVIGLAADVVNEEQVSTAFARIKQHFGCLNGLVNNAGLARPSSVEHLNHEEVVLQVNTNYLGTVFCCQAVIPLLRGEINPRIINISSASARHFDEMSHLSIYASTKAAVERFSRDLSFELQPDGIGVTCVRPGAAATHFAEGWDFEKLSAGVEEWQRMGPHMNSGMAVEDVASAVVHCLDYPQHVAVDLLEVRPKQLSEKLKL